MRLSLLHLPWRRPDDFDILLPHKRQQRNCKQKVTPVQGGGGLLFGGPEGQAMTHLANGVYLTGLLVVGWDNFVPSGNLATVLPSCSLCFCSFSSFASDIQFFHLSFASQKCQQQFYPTNNCLSSKAITAHFHVLSIKQL